MAGNRPVGRPRLDPEDLTESHGLSMPRRFWKYLYEVGGGNWSRGARRLIFFHQAQEERELRWREKRAQQEDGNGGQEHD